MDNTTRLVIYIGVMAVVTYLIRMIPFAAFSKKIKSRFIKSFLFYVPYAVLAAMTFPAIFTATDSVISAVAGCAVAIFLSFKEKGLLIVALSACATVYVVEWLLRLLPIVN